MIQEGELLWTPGAETVERANVTDFTRWLARERGLTFADYAALWRWSVDDQEAFWSALWDYLGIIASAPYERVLASAEMPGARWFPGARLNYAEHALRWERPGSDAVVFMCEDAAPAGVPWPEFAGKVRQAATALRELGVKPGDRVASYAPNIPETLMMMFAVTAVGAVWASCSPDFGTRGVLDRLQQLKPKVLFCVDGYRYGGKPFDRRGELAEIVAGLDGLEHVIAFSRLDPARPLRFDAATLGWEEIVARPPVAREDFVFEHVAFDHPLWVLFSSGTTGLPKAIVQGHGGILMEVMKTLKFHMDIHEGERAFFYTTTGWMMWNAVATMLCLGAIPVLYDGNPAYPSVDALWRMADECEVAFFGASPSYVDIMRKNGVVPKERFKLEKLRAIMPAGSPVSAECTAWFYQAVKPDLWIATGSGGTDICSGLVGGVPTLPVYAGEIQARQLGTAVECFDEDGKPLLDEVGELVVTKPLPSMPLYFWGDESGARYRDAYFDAYPGVWRHGDLFRINARGGCSVLGRSDATLNRHGVRIGTAEIYRTLDHLPEIADCLIVNLDLAGGGFFMPLFVKLKPGFALDEGLRGRINQALRAAYTPRHQPDRIIEVAEIPYTLTGKKMEVPVRRILMGARPEDVLNRNAMGNPHTLDAFVEYARGQRDYRV
jgi:acetoacetyl-CoA synthetase